METSQHGIKTVGFLPGLAVFASVADILNRLEACSLAHLEVIDSFSYFDDDARAFVTGAFGAELGPIADE